MLKKLVLGFTTLAVMVASAASYNVTFYQFANVNGKQLKPGEYKLQLKDDNTAVLKRNKEEIEIAVHSETADKKFANTSVRFGQGDQIQEICIGGTKTKLVVGSASNMSSGTN